ncbi:MAG: YgjV family protein [Firmicutes bacterium]|nr:YgjV family protein [Bacillota bacterium]
MNFEITVSLWQWITSQVIGVICMVILVVCWQLKNKKHNLWLLTISRILGIAMVALLESWVLVAYFSVATLRGFAFIWLDKNRGRVGRVVDWAFLIVVWALTAVSMAMFAEGWYDWVMLGAAMLVTFGEWFRGVHILRVTVFISIVARSILFALALNIMGIIIEFSIMVSLIVFYVRHFRNAKNSTMPTHQ